jgi:hypothetical protein
MTYFVPELSAATAFEAEPDKVQCDNRAGIELLRAQMIPLYQVGLHQEWNRIRAEFYWHRPIVITGMSARPVDVIALMKMKP